MLVMSLMSEREALSSNTNYYLLFHNCVLSSYLSVSISIIMDRIIRIIIILIVIIIFTLLHELTSAQCHTNRSRAVCERQNNACTGRRRETIKNKKIKKKWKEKD